MLGPIGRVAGTAAASAYSAFAAGALGAGSAGAASSALLSPGIVMQLQKSDVAVSRANILMNAFMGFLVCGWFVCTFFSEITDV